MCIRDRSVTARTSPTRAPCSLRAIPKRLSIMTVFVEYIWAKTSACSAVLGLLDEALASIPPLAAPYAHAAAAAVDSIAAALHGRAQPGDRGHPDGEPGARARG